MTIKDIAAEAGVSISTVSRVINGAANVSPATVEKVLEIVRKNGFVPNQSSQVLRSAKTNKILVIIPTLSNSYFSLPTKGIVNTCLSMGYHAFLGVTEYSNAMERQYLNMMVNNQFDGVIAFYSHLPVEELEHIAKSNPYIQLSNPLPSDNLSSVSIDDRKAAYEATEFLIKKGHTRLAIISGRKGVAEQREIGFRECLRRHNMEIREEYIVYADYEYDNGFEYDSGIASFNKLYALPEPPTAILTIFDTFAIGVCKGALSRGLVPGKDLAVIGFDNSAVSKIYTPSLTSVSMPRYEMGCLATNILLEQIENKKIEVRKAVMPHELILREST